MQSEARIEDLLHRWKQSFDDGTDVAPADLCAEFPELLDELAQRIADLKSGAPDIRADRVVNE